MTEISSYIHKLERILLEYGNIAIAYSGGMDSSFLALFAKKVMPQKYLLVFVMSEFISQLEHDIAIETAKRNDFNMKIIKKSILLNTDVVENCAERCYFCKKSIFSTIQSEIDSNLILCDGSVVDDDDDYRPGKKALKELGVKSPLKEAGLTKAIISRILESWNVKYIARPAQSCLATRMHTGEQITQLKLDKIEKSERILISAGLANLRCRYHGDLLRIETSEDNIGDAVVIVRNEIEKLKSLGFKYIAVDVEGYKKGSMNS